ncbi:MAG: hypothetical protein AcusKO_45060 [Acuticoccus sp.]
MEEPEPWLSPERTAWAAMVVPWFMACERRIRCAHARAGCRPGRMLLRRDRRPLAPPTVPMVELPPDAPNPAFAPAEKLDLTDSLARARRRV